MKKTNVKRAAAFIAAAMLCTGGATAVLANQPISAENSIISPQNIAITRCENKFTLQSSTKVSCYGSTDVYDGYTAGVIVELQQNTGNWGTIKTWSSDRAYCATVDEYYTITKGYSYRLKLTHKAYNSSGKLVESITKYSNVIN